MSATARARALAITVLLGLIGLFAWSYFCDGFAATLLDPQLPNAEKIAALRAVFEATGIFAPLLYVLFVSVEVVLAPLPGTLLYLPGGAVFGGWWGGSLSLVGNTLGAGVACLLARGLVGRQAIEGFFERRAMRKTRILLRRRGWILIALLRVNPLTSSDLVSYAAGAAGLSAPRVMWGTFLGMAPLCYLQAHLAATLLDAAPWLLWPLILCGVLYIALVAYFIARSLQRTAVLAEAKRSIVAKAAIGTSGAIPDDRNPRVP